MRSANPALNSKTFDFGSYQRAAAANTARGGAVSQEAAPTMTLFGTASKTLVLVALVAMAAVFTFRLALPDGATPVTADGQVVPDIQAALPWVLGGAFGGFLVAMITIFWKKAAPVLAPLYAVLEGLFLGGISAMFEARFPGIAIQAVGLTFGTLASLLIVYMTGLIKPTENVKLGIVAATGGVCLVYLFSFIFSLFSHDSHAVLMIHQSGPIGIGFSIVVIIIAALNLVLDFDFIEQGVERGAPRYMEWYAGFGLLVTLVWLYIEFLHLLAKLRER